MTARPFVRRRAATDGDHQLATSRMMNARSARGALSFPNGDKIVVMPWSEKVRYASRKNGYHGGATPQEVVVPLCVFSTSPCLEGWRARPTSGTSVVARGW